MEVKKIQMPVHPWKKYGKRRLSQIKRIVIHHFAGNITIREAAELHVSKGWPGIGYWAVIDLDGIVYIVNDLDTISYNVRNGNTPTIGIALRGNYNTKLPDLVMLSSLSQLIASIQNILGPLPVHVHSDFVNTECPGSKLREWVRVSYPHISSLQIKSKSIYQKFQALFKTSRDHV